MFKLKYSEMDSLLQFLTSCKNYRYEILIFFVVFVGVWFAVFSLAKFVFDIVDFELDKMKKKYFDLRDKK
jgi:hypothetical protein